MLSETNLLAEDEGKMKMEQPANKFQFGGMFCLISDRI